VKRFLIIITLFFSTASLQAQKSSFWQKVNYFLTKPAVVDTTRIYQPKAGFSLGLFTTGQKASFDVDVNFMMDFGDDYKITGLSQYNLSEKLCKKIGLEVGYGNVNLGYGLEVGPRSASKKRTLAFNVIGKSWGVRLNYYKITNPFQSILIIDDFDFNDTIYPKELSSLQSFTIDGYYIFNNKRFAYPAAYKIGLVQRRTAGSWMLTARYMQGDLYNSPEASLDSYNLIDCFTTLQASIGGGYSVNFVLWHKDPINARDEKLRNLTVNLTAIPVITFCNYLKTVSYQYEEGLYNGEKVSKIWCHPMPNYIGSAAASITLGRFYFSTQFTYNWFYFRSNVAFNANQLDIPDYVDDLNIKGSFHDWMLKGLLVYKF